MSQFNASAVATAIVNAAQAQGIVVRTIIEQRQAAGKSYRADKALEQTAEALAARVNDGDIDAGSAKAQLSKIKRMLECKLDTLIDAAVLSSGMNAVAAYIRQAEGKKDGAGPGRPAGQGAGKTTKPADPAQAEKPAVPNDDAGWRQFLETMRAQVPSRKDWASSDIVAFQESCATMIALIKRNAK